MMKSCVLLFAMSLLTLAATWPADLSFADDVESKQEAIAANMSCEELQDTIDNYNLKAMTEDQFLDLTVFITNFMTNCFFDDDSENSQNSTKSSGHKGVFNAIIAASRWGIYFQLESLATQFKEKFIRGFDAENDAPTLTNATSEYPSLGKFITDMLMDFLTPDKTSMMTEESDVEKE
ncbi:Hypothetical predicted protein [Cloeon dipterum]|uniref:Uncharacterized protein n=1 Tax=Cloeon dipterum TaxID=197152 RepID=A0A8S1E381_9INSE|nr:Hypothetical predicted protein [Cloeon dipterum]